MVVNFHFLLVLVPLYSSKGKAGKLSQNTALNGYNCNVGEVAFEKDNMNKLGCAALCYGSKACLGFFYKPDTSHCVGCKVWYTTSEKPNRTWSGSLCYEKQVCPNGGDIKRGRSCYFARPSDGLTFNESTTYCEEHDAHVVQAETPDENTFLKAYLKSLSKPVYYAWQGLTDRRIEGAWEWYSTGDPVEFYDWDDGEPSNNTGENCGQFALERSNGKWNDVPCSYRRTDSITLCEKRVDE